MGIIESIMAWFSYLTFMFNRGFFLRINIDWIVDQLTGNLGP